MYTIWLKYLITIESLHYHYAAQSELLYTTQLSLISALKELRVFD